MRAQVTFKGGAQIQVDVTEFSTTRDPVTGGLTKLNWTTPDGWAAKLHCLDVTEVVAIVAIQAEPAADAAEAQRGGS